MQLEFDLRSRVETSSSAATIYVFPIASSAIAVTAAADWCECRGGGNPKYRLAVSAQRAAAHLHMLRLPMADIALQEMRFAFAVIDELKRRGTIPHSLADGDLA